MPYAIRKPRHYVAECPGYLVQIDMLDVRPLDEMAVKLFTVRDVISRWDMLEVHQRATANITCEFLETDWTVCPSRSEPSRWKGAVSTGLDLNKPVSASASVCSSCRFIPPS